MKKVNNIIQIVKKSYDLLANDFHEHFNSSFRYSVFSECTMFRGGELNYNTDTLNKFIDRCVYYRLGISDQQPKKGEIIYDLSTTISPEQFEDSVDSIFAELVYCAYPAKLISKLQKQLEAHKLDPKVITHIIGKLECESN